MEHIELDVENIKTSVSEGELDNIQSEVNRIHDELERGLTPGSGYLGWMHQPSRLTGEVIDRIKGEAEGIREDADAFVVIGIGGSYLGAKAAIEFLHHTFSNQLSKEDRGSPEIYFAGLNLSSDYLQDLMDLLEGKSVYLNVISKSGTTTEPAVAFRVLKRYLEERYGAEGARKRIFVTTDKDSGALREMANKEGYSSLEIPANIGGRYSVLTPVGLLPVAVSGTDIVEVIEGARDCESVSSIGDLRSNPAYLYAAIRNLLYLKGLHVEILAVFNPSLRYLAEWWKQLAGESEGKDGRGIYPASVEFTTDLHSMGQWIQDGRRMVFETFLTLKETAKDITIPHVEDDTDGLNYIAGRSLDYVNDKAYVGVRTAHLDGGVPNMTIELKDRSPYSIGQLFYFFEKAIAVSGRLMKINPFDQPGVEHYKRNMFSLLGKPGFSDG